MQGFTSFLAMAWCMFGVVQESMAWSCTNDHGGMPACHFDKGVCGVYFSESVGEGSILWKRGQSIRGDSTNNIAHDWQPRNKTRKGSFFYLDVTNQAIPDGSKARLSGNIVSSHANAVCITVHYATTTDGHGTPTITLYNHLPDGTSEFVIGNITDDTNGEWKFKDFNSCVENMSVISFESKKLSKNTLVALDYIDVRQANMNCSYVTPPPILNITTSPSNTTPSYNIAGTASVINTATIIATSTLSPGITKEGYPRTSHTESRFPITDVPIKPSTFEILSEIIPSLSVPSFMNTFVVYESSISNFPSQTYMSPIDIGHSTTKVVTHSVAPTKTQSMTRTSFTTSGGMLDTPKSPDIQPIVLSTKAWSTPSDKIVVLSMTETPNPFQLAPSHSSQLEGSDVTYIQPTMDWKVTRSGIMETNGQSYYTANDEPNTPVNVLKTSVNVMDITATTTINVTPSAHVTTRSDTTSTPNKTKDVEKKSQSNSLSATAKIAVIASACVFAGVILIVAGVVYYKRCHINNIINTDEPVDDSVEYISVRGSSTDYQMNRISQEFAANKMIVHEKAVETYVHAHTVYRNEYTVSEKL